MSFIGELKRRNVVRVGIAYAVIGWVLAQIAEFAFENFGAPEWVLKSFVVLLLLGLPLVLFIAWAFEITPEGIKREKDIDRSKSITSQTGRKLDFLIIGILAVAVTYFAYDKFAGTPSAVTASDAEQSIAVLPFANMSDDSDHFADGLTEELLNLLAKNDDLKVAGRTSSFAFKGRNEDLREIGEALGVTKVLEGSVRRDGESIRVTAQLINVEDGFHIWSDTYDRNLASIFEIQDEVAGAITRALELHLTPEAKRLTNNPEAYAAYLEAVSMAAFNRDSDVANGIAALDRATALDPQFAKAYELRSWYYWMNAGWYVATDIGQARVYEDAMKALEIDPDMHGAKALAVSAHPTDWTWIKEMETLDALVKIDRSVRVLDSYAWDLLVTGYLSEAEAIHREILARDPLSSNSWYRLAETLYGQGRDAEAREAGQKASELSPDFWNQGYSVVFHAELAAGNYEAAANVIVRRYDEEWFQTPDFETFVDKMTDPETGRDSLVEWVTYRRVADDDGSGVVFANTYYLFFGQLDLYEDVIDSFAGDSSAWTDAESMQSWGTYLPFTGYRKSQHFLERAKIDGLFELWEHRGPPDFCSKETGEWVCW
ncbi:MAG: hypothetical protein ACR2QS_16780 [Woeseiaceae bacterium]